MVSPLMSHGRSVDIVYKIWADNLGFFLGIFFREEGTLTFKRFSIIMLIVSIILNQDLKEEGKVFQED